MCYILRSYLYWKFMWWLSGLLVRSNW